MELVKVSTKNQVDVINESLSHESDEEYTHPFFVIFDYLDLADFFNLVHNGEVVGIAAIKYHQGGCAEIYKLYVFKQYRGRAIGTLAVECIIDFLKKERYIKLWVQVLTFNVIPFWRGLNFEPFDPDYEENTFFERII